MVQQHEKISENKIAVTAAYAGGGAHAVQLKNNREYSVVQRKLAEGTTTTQLASFMPVQRKTNHTGLPDHLKSGIENLSGHSMDDVKVHYNSAKPAQLNAHAYAQGTDIHLASGQEKHLPHEAWHVVQQKQGRVKPTLQMKGKVNVNDDSGLEKEADVMGAKAVQLKNYGSQSSMQQSSSSGIQTVYQRVTIKLDGETYFPDTHATGKIVESDDLTLAQRTKASTDLQGNADLFARMQAGWTHLTQTVDPIIEPLLAAAEITDEAVKITARGLYLASQNAGVALSVLLDAQKEWQDFLSYSKIPMPDILSVHRSFGFEYEFATWQVQPPNKKPVDSHTEVGKSGPFSPLFNIPFILETDAQEELELVAPPLLAGGANGVINKAFISQVHALFVADLVAFRAANANVRAKDLPFNDHIGTGWTWNESGNLIKIAVTRNKWDNKPNKIGYQLNIALTPDEIAGQFKANAPGAEAEHETVYGSILNRFRINPIYAALTPERKTAIDPAILLLSKGISNSIAIPTLRLVASTRKPWVGVDLHSHVKDLHGIWVKDSVPNITVAALKGKNVAQNDLKSIITSEKDWISRHILTKIPKYKPSEKTKKEVPNPALDAMRAAHNILDTKAGETTSLKKEAEAEALACLTAVETRLTAHNEVAGNNTKTAFLAETFGTGNGVRKDTYANIPGSAGRTLHLAELRSNLSTDAFLAP
ncbi:DUF4157 domain-containing protein [Flavobacterium pectinovorum]|uniref:DUF4157 domain-containing protein n=1 Tax=Flavobacterium pectinovorum TaxID=29533 RepID=A0A502EUQ0_9FLAO|nr:DUF4157 domain-containing protein [Flavobacterium pectinovorum]TPG40832.1 DUF4157 domain-containing protein [Flavobacterium pectinovorum]